MSTSDDGGCRWRTASHVKRQRKPCQRLGRSVGPARSSDSSLDSAAPFPNDPAPGDHTTARERIRPATNSRVPFQEADGPLRSAPCALRLCVSASLFTVLVTSFHSNPARSSLSLRGVFRQSGPSMRPCQSFTAKHGRAFGARQARSPSSSRIIALPSAWMRVACANPRFCHAGWPVLRLMAVRNAGPKSPLVPYT